MEQKVTTIDITTFDMLEKLFSPSIFLSIEDISQVVGMSARTIRNLRSMEATTLPLKKVNGRVVCHILKLAQWLEENGGVADPENEQ